MIARHLLGNAYPIKKLESVVEFLDHKRRPITESDRKPGPYPYYGANGPQGWIDDYIFDEPLILLAEDGGHFDSPNRGVAYRVSGKTWVNNHAHVLRPTEEVDIGFLCRVLENYDLTPFITGTTRGKLTKAGASEIPVIVPPMEEQRRIAAILDQAETLRAQRRTALALLDSLTQSLFLDMFGDPANNPMSWETLKVEQLAEQVTDGEHLTPKREPQGVKLLSARNVRDGYIDFQNVDFVGQVEHERIKKRCNPVRGDVLISCSGSIGRVASVETDEPFSLVRSVAMIRPKTNFVLTKFLEYYLRTPAMNAYMIRRANASSQANLFQGPIREMPVTVPPLLLQQTFATRIASIEALKATHRRALAALDALFASLQQRAFAGQL